MSAHPRSQNKICSLDEKQIIILNQQTGRGFTRLIKALVYKLCQLWVFDCLSVLRLEI